MLTHDKRQCHMLFTKFDRPINVKGCGLKKGGVTKTLELCEFSVVAQISVSLGGRVLGWMAVTIQKIRGR